MSCTQRAYEPFRGYEQAQVIDIPSGSGTNTIGQRLIAAGVVRDELTFRVALWLSGSARRLQAGEYRFDQPLSAVDVVGKIARGEVDLRPITFPEGLTIAEMSKIFEANGLGTASAFVAASKDGSLVSELDPGARDLEGYLFPDTYALPRTADAQRVVKVMVERFKQVMTEELVTAAKARGWSVRQLVTLASLVEKETARAEERPLVAAVYANRLMIGMGLQCDPDSDLCAADESGSLTATCAERIWRSTPLTTPTAIPGCRPGRSPRRAKDRSRPPHILPTRISSTSSAATTDRTSSPRRSTSTIGTCGSIRCNTSGTGGSRTPAAPNR